MMHSSSSGAWTARLRNLWQKVAQTSRESWQLTRACSKPSPSSSSTTLSALSSDRVKTILLQHAQMNNRVAVRILLLEKEWGLIKYHGTYGYLQQKWTSRRALPIDKNKSDQEQRNNDKKEEDTAQIAFMITSRMKQQLQEELSYSETLIKSMTPLQASLVLKHKIDAAEYDGRLPQLEEEYRIRAERKFQEEQGRRAQQEHQEKEEMHLEAVDESLSTSAHLSISQDDLLQVTSSNAEPASASMNQLNEVNTITWYEVIQTQPNGEENTMGLYRTPEEAQEGIDALKYIAEKRQESTKAKLSMRPSLR